MRTFVALFGLAALVIPASHAVADHGGRPEVADHGDHEDGDHHDGDVDPDDGDESHQSCDSARCAVIDEIAAACPCDSATNHGKYVSCVAHAAKAAGVPERCRGDVVSCAARSACGTEGAVACDVPEFGRCRRSTGTCEGTDSACGSFTDCPEAPRCEVKRSAAACAAVGGTVRASGTCCDDCSATTTTTSSTLPSSSSSSTSSTESSTSSSTSTSSTVASSSSSSETSTSTSTSTSSTAGSAAGALVTTRRPNPHRH